MPDKEREPTCCTDVSRTSLGCAGAPAALAGFDIPLTLLFRGNPLEGDSPMGRNTVLRRQTLAAAFLSTVVSLGVSATATASTIVVSPTFAASNQSPDTIDYEGIFYDFSSTFPPASIAIATFDFTIPKGDG